MRTRTKEIRELEAMEYRHEGQRAKINVETRRVTYGAKRMCRDAERCGMQVRYEYMVSSVRTYIFMMAD